MKLHKCFGFRLRAISAALAVAALALTSGCFLIAVGVAGAAGAGTVAYMRGELNGTLASGYDEVIAATESALAQLQFARVSETKDAFSAVIIARTAEDDKIEIKLTYVADKRTKVQIRIGIFGDEEKSRAILDKTKANLS